MKFLGLCWYHHNREHHQQHQQQREQLRSSNKRRGSKSTTTTTTTIPLVAVTAAAAAATTTLLCGTTLILPTASAFTVPPFLVRNVSSGAGGMSKKSDAPMPPGSAPAAEAEEDISQADMKILEPVVRALENRWVRSNENAPLSQETTENLIKSRRLEGLDVENDDNRTKRPVYNGHYVLAKPKGLPKPRLVLYSPDVANRLLQLTKEQVESDAFLAWVSGNAVLGETWATPYALSIMGTRYTNNCPYGTGDGYGDGRAISIGDLRGHELQIKGAGTTPFCRNADGRAVLRSSIREFLASEAMHWLGVGTTRALSLVVSDDGGETIHRPWYTDDAVLQIPSEDDPRLAAYPADQRAQIIRQLRNQKADPNVMIQEKAAMTTRVATSFMRIGHIDLFARRVEKVSMRNADKQLPDGMRYDTNTREWKELEQIIWHACYREFRQEAYDPYYDKGDLASAAAVLLERSAELLATMVANWIRVGFVQGNFNADNCLIGGNTMDYGPFGWMEEYSPVAAKWTGSGQHFGFLNQPSAAYANYNVLVSSVVPVICAATNPHHKDPDEVARPFLERANELFNRKLQETFCLKMGFEVDQVEVADEVWEALEPLLRSSRVDWTVFFRQLTYVVRDFASDNFREAPADSLMGALEGNEEVRAGSSPFYEPLGDEKRQEWMRWLDTWRTALVASSAPSDDDNNNDEETFLKAAYERMRTSNPKFVLREWMMVKAYRGAADNEEAELFYLNDLIQRPYEEGSDDETEQYYRRAPERALTAGGTAFFS